MRKKLIVVTSVALLLSACGGGGSGPEISDARLGQPTGPNAALYFTATSDGDADRLIGATTEVASAVEVHETMMSDDGTMSMRSVQSLDLPADGTLVLEPGGFHLMLLDAERLEIGDTVQVTLKWEMAGEQTIDAEVVDPGDTMGNG